MSGAVAASTSQVQYNPGAQAPAQNNNAMQLLQILASILPEIGQLLQQMEGQGGQQGGAQPGFGSQPGIGSQPGFGTPAAGGGAPQAGSVGGAQPGSIGGGGQMNAQSASGALSSYMSQNGIGSLNPNQLYQLAYNPPSGATQTDSQAAKWMLQNPSVFNQIETHDVAGSDGIAGVNDFQWAAQGGLGNAGGAGGGAGGAGGTGGGLPQTPSFGSGGGGLPQTPSFGSGGGGLPQVPSFPSTPLQLGPGLAQPQQGGGQMNAQSASGALSSYMSANNVGSLDPNQLYQLAYNPPSGATQTDSQAAKWMLQNPSVFNQIETHDVAGSDGIAGVNDFQWAAQGGIGGAGAANGLNV